MCYLPAPYLRYRLKSPYFKLQRGRSGQRHFCIRPIQKLFRAETSVHKRPDCAGVIPLGETHEPPHYAVLAPIQAALGSLVQWPT